jgi:tol-pal system protein YbgF
MKAIFSILLILFVLSMVPGCATQEDAIILDSRIKQVNQGYGDLQKSIDVLQDKNDAVTKANMDLAAEFERYRQSREAKDQKLRKQAAELRIAIEALRQENQKLQGNIDESGHALKKNAAGAQQKEQKLRYTVERLEKKNQASAARIARLEQYLNLEPAGQKTAPKKGNSAGTAVSKTASADSLYNSAKKAFDQEDFESSLGGFQKFIKRYPSSGNADNAQFWIGEIYYREKWYEKAILEYQKVIEKYPKGNKIQASLLKQGFAFFQIGDKTNGRLILKELIKKHPQSNEAKIAEKRLKNS